MDKPKTMDELLQGHLLGTQAAVRALILLHPDPAAARAFVAQEMERWLAAGLASASTSEPMLQGIESAKRAALPSDADILRTRPDAG